MQALLIAAAALGALSCGDSARQPTGPADPSPTLDHRGDRDEDGGSAGDILRRARVGLLKCSRLPTSTATATIGSAGGVIRVGPHLLMIPAGALVAPVSITAVAPSSRVRQVSFEPEGLVFLQPARLTMSYAGCKTAGSLLPKRIAYTTNTLSIIEYLLSVDNLAGRTVSADLSHFSKYAVAW